MFLPRFMVFSIQSFDPHNQILYAAGFSYATLGRLCCIERHSMCLGHWIATTDHRFGKLAPAATTAR